MDRDVIVANEELRKLGKPKRNRARQAKESSPFYSIQQVLELVPISKSSLYLMVKNGEFPAQKKLGKRAAVWSKEEVHNWIQSKLGGGIA